MQTVVFDLEATCWEGGSTLEEQEIIEIGAVRLDSGFEIADEFSELVRPVIRPILSDFCMQLTGIMQQDVDTASEFRIVGRRFLEWIGQKQCTPVSWGAYDLRHLELECRRHDVILPSYFGNAHINLKGLFAKKSKIRQCGMKAALKILRLDFEGMHHRGLDDARNIAKIARIVLADANIEKQSG